MATVNIYSNNGALVPKAIAEAPDNWCFMGDFKVEVKSGHVFPQTKYYIEEEVAGPNPGREVTCINVSAGLTSFRRWK